jgi:hypothetical protein
MVAVEQPATILGDWHWENVLLNEALGGGTPP